jgi:mono/diheme cytochrome c family protein
MGKRWRGWLVLCGAAAMVLAMGSAACSRKASEDAGSTSPAQSSHEALVERGRQVFQANCTTCHSIDPRQPGPVGPAIAGSPLELLRYKVLHNEYPPGYKPQRTTHAMIPFPQLEGDLPAIAAYLDSLTK